MVQHLLKSPSSSPSFPPCAGVPPLEGFSDHMGSILRVKLPQKLTSDLHMGEQPVCHGSKPSPAIVTNLQQRQLKNEFVVLFFFFLATSGLRCCAWAFSSCGEWPLERRLSSCGARAQLLRSMWDLPGPGLEPVSPALAGGFLTTVPPGKPRKRVLKTQSFINFVIRHCYFLLSIFFIFYFINLYSYIFI